MHARAAGRRYDANMSEVIVVAAITAGTTLAATLGATSLANRHSRRIAMADRRAEREDEARHHIVDALEAGAQWINAATGYAAALAMAGSAAAGRAYLMSSHKHETANDMADGARALDRSLTAAILLLGPSALLDRLVGLRERIEAFGDEVTKPTLASLERHDVASAPGLSYGLDFARDVKHQLREVERVAAAHFRSRHGE